MLQVGATGIEEEEDEDDDDEEEEDFTNSGTPDRPRPYIGKLNGTKVVCRYI
jgi:hypothetical protein